MILLSNLIIISIAALVHASFQLTTSVLTLLSGHTMGKKAGAKRLVKLSSSFVFGSITMTALLLVAAVYIATQMARLYPLGPATWAVSSGLLLGLSIAVYVLYYRQNSSSTALWLPRDMADYLKRRAKLTKASGEAFALGLSSVATEILFIIPPMLVSVLAILSLDGTWQLVGIGLYAVLSSLSVIVVWVLVSGGHSLSRIQRWRNQNKNFLRAIAGIGLLVLGFYVYVEKVAEIPLLGVSS